MKTYSIGACNHDCIYQRIDFSARAEKFYSNNRGYNRTLIIPKASKQLRPFPYLIF